MFQPKKYPFFCQKYDIFCHYILFGLENQRIYYRKTCIMIALESHRQKESFQSQENRNCITNATDFIHSASNISQNLVVQKDDNLAG